MCEDSVAVVMADIRDLLSDSAASSVERKVLEINAGYSEGASYEFRFYHLTDKQCSHPSGTKRHPAWGKLFAVNHSLFGPSPVKIVLYLDSDAYIHLHTLRVGKPNFPLVLWGDERGPEDLANTGVQLWTASAESRNIVESWWKQEDGPLYEQDSFHEVIQQQFRSDIKILPNHNGFLRNNLSDFNEAGTYNKIVGWRHEISVSTYQTKHNPVLEIFVVHMWADIKRRPFAPAYLDSLELPRTQVSSPFWSPGKMRRNG